jgi:uncharacterized membrane protein
MNDHRNVPDERRLAGIDAIRGVAMICVCMAHVGDTYAWLYSPALGNLLITLGKFATPNFLLMSGLVAGYQLSLLHSSRALRRIVERGLFVLLVGHVLVTAATIYISRPETAIRGLVITDVIGLLLCTTPLLRFLSSRQLITCGAALFTVCSLVAFAWRPDSEPGQLLGALLLGIEPAGREVFSTTIPAYLGIFMIGMGIGPLIAAARGQGCIETVGRGMALVGLTCVTVAVGANVAEHFLRHAYEAQLADGGVLSRLLAAGDIRQKNPPGLAYLLFYGGAGLCLAGVLMREAIPAFFRGPVYAAATIGRASFVSYISQQWIITFIPIFFGFDAWFSAPSSLAYLVLACTAMFLVARWWGRVGGNQFLFFSTVLGLNFTFATRAAP